MSTVHGKINDRDAQRRVANIDPEEISSNEHALLPLFWGTRPLSAFWIGDIFNQYGEPIRADSG
ncbi:MAG: hypothetical protein AAGF10_05400, partial [Verrucomicrobiota bacterium]